MPATLALVLTLGVIVFLFRRDFREKPNVTSALWIPILWTFIIASKPVSKWCNILGLPVTGGSSSIEDMGSPLDIIVFVSLMMAGVRVLAKRQINLSEILRDNAWLVAFVAYCFVSLAWSEYPFVGFKRWIKIFGHPIMVLIIFTEPNPKEALLTLLKRCAYVLFPVSILWMKYYPLLGRKASEYGGMTNCGITTGKNSLGNLSAILSLFFVWHLLQVWRTEKNATRRYELKLTGGLLLLSGYCLAKAHSATANICLMLGVGIMMLLAFRSVNKKLVGAYAVGAILLLVFAQLSFDIYGRVVDISGHEDTIEGRGVIWAQLMHFGTNPFFGVGFETFWLGENLVKMHEGRPWQPNEAHNGYIEIYLNLGIVGLLLLAGIIFSAFRKIRFDLLGDFEWGRFQMGCLVMLLARSWTEAGFRGLSFPFFIFFLIAMNYPTLRIATSRSSNPDSSPESERELIHTVKTGC